MAGYIKIDRKILDWGWYQDVKVFHFFLYLLLRANHKDGVWKGTLVRRGQVIIGREKSSVDTGLTENEIRTCIKKLILTNEITSKSTNKFTVVTICKYAFYQDGDYTNNQQNNQQVNQQITNKTPTNNQPLTTNKNDNNNKEDNTATAEIVEMGIVLVKKIANEVWKDKVWVESLCMGNGLKMSEAKDWMVQFNLSISQDTIIGFNEKKYKKMFSGWLRMKLGGGQKVTKVTDKKNEEIEMLKKHGL